MIYVLIGMSLLFVAIGFVVTEKNAKFLLSGYNTMSEVERNKVDIKKYIPYFRKFHIFLGISFLTIGTFLNYFINENVSGIFLTVYPIIAYIFFISTTTKYFNGVSLKRNKVGVIILIGTLLLVLGLLGYGFQENKLTFDTKSIWLDGSYGEIINPSEIKSIELLNQLPEITIKTNGFALGTIKKGYFKTNTGEIVKLILNSDRMPIILLTKIDGNKIYFSAKQKSNEELVSEMKKALPNLLYKQ